ncbi:MAG: hypothetical protein WC325_03765 [Candidatus Bathyarchaeia archaeon]
MTVPVQGELSWDIKVVDEKAQGIGYGFCPIAVDSNDNPHIAYSGSPDARYASWNSKDWGIQKIEYASVHDLKLDANGNPHISFGSLAYARLAGGKWDIHEVTTDHTVYSSLALDSDGNPHIAYTTGNRLKYATQNGTNWTIQTVRIDSTLPDINPMLSLVLDSNNTPHIMYYNESSYVNRSIGGARFVNVNLAVWKNSRWDIEPVLSSLNLGQLGNMVIDSNDNIHFLCTQNRYLSAENPALVSNILYVRWDGFAWNAQTVASNVELGYLGFLALGPDGGPHIIYIVGDVIYTRWTGTKWENQTLGNLTDRKCYLAVDSNGNPHISYLKVPPGEPTNSRILYLMYATTTIPEASTDTDTEPTQPTSPDFPDLPLLLVSTAVIIGAVMTVLYVWKRKT